MNPCRAGSSPIIDGAGSTPRAPCLRRMNCHTNCPCCSQPTPSLLAALLVAGVPKRPGLCSFPWFEPPPGTTSTVPLSPDHLARPVSYWLVPPPPVAKGCWGSRDPLRHLLGTWQPSHRSWQEVTAAASTASVSFPRFNCGNESQLEILGTNR